MNRIESPPEASSGPDEEAPYVPFIEAMQPLRGKWKIEILWALAQRTHRFGELRRALPGITQHMLSLRLRELEADGLVSRTVYAEVPPRVEYEMTAKARGLGPTMEALAAWWNEYGQSVPGNPAARGRKPKTSRAAERL